MKNPPGRAFCLLLPLLLLLATLAAGQPSATRLDSLRQLRRWPLPVQQALAQARLLPDAPAVPVVKALVQARGAGLPPAIYHDLLTTLGRCYIDNNELGRAVGVLLEAWQPTDPDSARASRAAMWLCYGYLRLQQPARAQDYGRAALLHLPRHPAYAAQQSQLYSILAEVADARRDYEQEERYLRQLLTLDQARRDLDGQAVDWLGMAQLSQRRGRLAQARHYLDSARRCCRPPVPDGIRMLERQQTASLALARHQYWAAEQALRPVRPLIHRRLLWESEVLTLLVPALAGQGRYREAFGHQQRLYALQTQAFEESTNRYTQELQASYATARRERELTRQRQRIALLQAQAQLRTAQYGRRLAALGAAVLAGGLLLTLGLVWWAGRQRHLRAQREARLRSRIAADLHDEVGTLLARVSMQADLLNQQQPGRDPALARLLGNSRAAASTMRDIVWSIDAQADTAGALLDRIRDYLDELAVPPALHVQLRTEGLHDADPLPPELRQQVYLIFKEAVTNALRHATQATVLGVTLRRYAGQLELLIENDGPAVAAAPGRSGLGLRSMRQRASSLHAGLVAGPRPGGGFRVQLTVPA